MVILIQILIAAVIYWLIFSYLVPKLPSPVKEIVSVILALFGIVWLLGLIGFTI